ncbi:ComF family protein [Lysobacter capsici]|nr:ComF family protein [Lysobacter capsici]
MGDAFAPLLDDGQSQPHSSLLAIRCTDPETTALTHDPSARADIANAIPHRMNDPRIAARAHPQAAAASHHAGAAPPVLVPIPLHRSRLRERGYDQALELARPLARQLGLPLQAQALTRVRDTSAQSQLDASQRRRNLRDAFAWNGDVAMPAHIVLIDDVMTTGATLHSAARVLRRAGALRVDAWVCARVP